jgi:hypothetical protein
LGAELIQGLAAAEMGWAEGSLVWVEQKRIHQKLGCLRVWETKDEELDEAQVRQF